MSDELVTAKCPFCKVLVEGTRDEFSRPLKCPNCKATGHFQPILSDEEILAKGASATAKGVERAGLFAGKLLKKASLFGLAKYKEHKERAQVLRDLRDRFLSHLGSERPTDLALGEFQTQCNAAGVDLKEVVGELYPKVVRSFFERELSLLSREQGAKPEVVAVLEKYSAILCQSQDTRAQISQTLARAKLIQEIRSGRSDPLADVTGLVVRNSEIVWHQCDASAIVRERSNNTSMHPGRLFVTNLRLAFTSRTAPDEFQYGDINAVEVEGDRLFLTGRSQRSCAEFLLVDPDIAAEHVRYAVRMFHRQVDVGFESNGTKHISQEVKLVVYQRDGGKCVQCGASDYLEYDHIIPGAKGGANTIQNVQLLCRRCNSKKSDRI